MPMICWTMQDIADHAGVSRQAVHLWSRRPDFPHPVVTSPPRGKGAIQMWAPNDIADWLAKNPRPSA